MKLYLAGPMMGYVDHNYPLFEYARNLLRAAGWDIACPAEMHSPREISETKSRRQLMQEDFALLFTCDGIALLPDWSKSRGATGEFQVAQVLDMPIFHVPELLPDIPIIFLKGTLL